MSANFFRAINDANLSVTTSRDGSRQFGRGAHMDREDERPTRGSYNNRGRSRGRYRGRSGGGRFNNRRGGRFRESVNPMSRFDDDNGDEDQSMGDNASSRMRYKPYGGYQGYRRGYQHQGNSDRRSFGSKWFKISIPGGRNHEQNWLISKLKSLVTLPFECVEFHCVGDSACFFVDDKDVADALKMKSNRITLRDGSKLTIIVRPSDPPRITGGGGGMGRGGRKNEGSSFAPKGIDSEILINCLAQRYIVESKAVNLSKLSDDTVLAANDIKRAAGKPWLFLALFDTIHNINPEIAGLDLSGNEIRSLDMLRNVQEKLPKLETLSIKNNEIQSLDQLDFLKSIESLRHLHVDGNPFCSQYQDNLENLKRDVRSRLHNIETLDGVQLPPPILFDLPKSAPLPSSKMNYIPHPELEGQIGQFVQQYFQIYDSDDRQGLLDFYHDQATLSLCVNSNVYSKGLGRERQQPLNEYFQISRNLKRLRDKAKRASLIKHTKLATVAFLNELPKTRHALGALGLDVSMTTGQFVCLTFRGLFFEGNSRDVPRAFSRTFILLKSDKGMKIINDQLHIRNPSQETQKAETSSAPTETVSQQQALPQLTMEQQQLVRKFSEASKMNISYSLQCLQQNDWNFEKSGEIFMKLQREGKLPAEAFVS